MRRIRTLEEEILIILSTLPAMLDKQCSVYLLIDFRTFWYNPRAFDGKKEKSIQETFLKYGQIRFL